MKKEKLQELLTKYFTPGSVCRHLTSTECYPLFELNFGFSSPEECKTHFENFPGTLIEFAEYAKIFNSDWTSFHPSCTYNPESLDKLYDLALHEKNQIEIAIIIYETQLCAEYLYGENIMFGGLGHVIPEELDFGYNLLIGDMYHSRCDGHHSRYRRRCDKVKHKNHKIEHCIANIPDENGNLLIKCGYLWKRYINAQTALGICRSIEFSLHDLKVTHRTEKKLFSIVKKYKKMISFAKHFNYYYDGHYFFEVAHNKES